MASRIDIELTSRREDGSWTWRAAGARQPKGVVDADLVPVAASVGDHLRAEVDFGVDGLAVTAVIPAKPAQSTGSAAPQRIEIIGSGQPTGGVSVTLAGGRRAPSGEHGRPGGPGRGRRPGAEREGGGTGRGAPGRAGPRPAAARRPGGNEAGPAGGGTRPGADARPGADGRRPAARGAGRPQHERQPGQPGQASRPERGGRSDRSEPGERGRRRFQPSTTYRNAALGELRPEELPVAEQLLRGGIPRVRQAIEEQNARTRSEGRDEVSAAPLLAMAEALLPKMNLAAWKDRAASARAAGRETPLRELRSIVTAASAVNLDEEGRSLATALRTALDERVEALRDAWLSRMTKALDEGRVLDALTAAGRPPEHGARLPADLAVRLAEQAGTAMTADLTPESWSALLQAVIDSPVRRTVHPAALPAGADDALRATARRAAGLVPELARLLGLPIPPPPGPRRPAPAARRA
ncbi:MAG: hypothetical protein M0013_02380 [Actinomycetota bacterium]|jgi:hypothetical protein|nr:hypothetical protein [Actinomycetota bacterium]